MSGERKRLTQIMMDYNQDAGAGIIPISAKDFYFVMELLNMLMMKDEKSEG